MGNSTTLQTWASLQTVSVLKKKTLREFDSMTDCLEQVHSDIKVTNKKLSALYKFKIDSAENKRKREWSIMPKKVRSAKRKGYQYSMWDIVVMIMNEIRPTWKCWNYVKTPWNQQPLLTCSFCKIKCWRDRNFIGKLKLKKADLFANCAEKLVDKAQNERKNQIFKSYAE